MYKKRKKYASCIPSEKGAREYRQMPIANARRNYIETSFMISLSQKLSKRYNMSKNAHCSPVHAQ